MIMRERRRKYLVNKRLQLQFVTLLILQASLPIIVMGSSLYILNKMYLLKLQKAVGTLVVSDADVQGILNFSILAVIALLILTGLLLIFIGIRFSHHIAGPLYKLEKSMDSLARGEKVEPISLRKTDILSGLVDKLNVIINRLNKLKE